MRRHFFDLAFTPAVQAEQVRRGSRAAYAAAAGTQQSLVADALSEQEISFIQARDSCYIATVSENGWPYIQHRGGPPGFIRHLNYGMIGWLEFAGNRQYISIGNAATNDRVAMFFMDYPNRRRLKVLGHVRVNDPGARPDLVLRLDIGGYKARVERAVTVQVEAFDWNCPQHIMRRFTQAEYQKLEARLYARIAELEERLSACEPAAGLPYNPALPFPSQDGHDR